MSDGPTYRDAETLARVYYESAGWEWDALEPGEQINNTRSFIAVTHHVAERIAQARREGVTEVAARVTEAVETYGLPSIKGVQIVAVDRIEAALRGDE